MSLLLVQSAWWSPGMFWVILLDPDLFFHVEALAREGGEC